MAIADALEDAGVRVWLDRRSIPAGASWDAAIVRAIRDCLLAVFPAIPYCIDLIEGPYLTTNESVVKAFRPKGA